MSPLNQEDLDKEQCGVPTCDHTNCTELFVSGRCHMGAPVRVCYDKSTGVLTVTCAICQQFIVDIEVQA